MKTQCQDCKTEWTGLRIEHCKACHQTFTGTTSGDKHRTGKHDVREGPDRRRCRTTLEMLEVGLELNDRDQWTSGGTSPWAAGGSLDAGEAAGPLEIDTSDRETVLAP